MNDKPINSHLELKNSDKCIRMKNINLVDMIPKLDK
jgi:hypothetical protein